MPSQEKKYEQLEEEKIEIRPTEESVKKEETPIERFFLVTFCLTMQNKLLNFLKNHFLIELALVDFFSISPIISFVFLIAPNSPPAWFVSLVIISLLILLIVRSILVGKRKYDLLQKFNYLIMILSLTLFFVLHLIFTCSLEMFYKSRKLIFLQSIFIILSLFLSSKKKPHFSYIILTYLFLFSYCAIRICDYEVINFLMFIALLFNVISNLVLKLIGHQKVVSFDFCLYCSYTLLLHYLIRNASTERWYNDCK